MPKQLSGFLAGRRVARPSAILRATVVAVLGAQLGACASMPQSANDSAANVALTQIASEAASWAHKAQRAVQATALQLAMLEGWNPRQTASSLIESQLGSVDNDKVLAAQRGRGLPGDGNVVYFGLDMETQASNLQHTFNADAGARFGMDQHGITVNQTWTVQSGDNHPTFPTNGDTVSGNLDNNGVGQLVQVAGNDNEGKNTTIINVTHSNINFDSSTPDSTGCSGSISCNSVINTVNNTVETSISIPGLNALNSISALNGLSQQIAINTVQAVVNNITTLNVQLGQQPNIDSGFLGTLVGLRP